MAIHRNPIDPIGSLFERKRFGPALRCNFALAVHGLLRESAQATLGAGLERIGRYPKRALLFRTDDPVATTPGAVEVRSGTAALMAFGLHPSGQPYAWIGDSPATTRAADLPAVTGAQIAAFLHAAHAALPASMRPRPKVQPAAHRAPMRSSVLSDSYIDAAVQRELLTLAQAKPGERNATLCRVAFALGRFVATRHVDRDALVRGLLDVSAAIGLSPAEAMGTVRSAMRARGISL